MSPSYTRDGAADCYWLETSASAGRPVPRAYASAILTLARRHGFYRAPTEPCDDRGIRWLRFRHADGRELWLKGYTGNAW